MKKQLLAAAIALGFAAAAHAEPCNTSMTGYASTPLTYSAEQNNAANVRCLLEAGADVNAANDAGETPLVSAMLHEGRSPRSRFDTVQTLLKAGADPNLASSRLGSPLNVAAANDNVPRDVVQLLLDAGALIDAPVPKDGRTPLMNAAFSGNTTTMQLLLDKGASLTAVDHSGATALAYAARKGMSKTVQLLLDKGADLTAVDHSGATMLHYAAHGIYGTALHLLLAKGANPNATDNYGATPLAYAATFDGCADNAEVLLNNGANPNSADKDGRTPLMAAAEHANTSTLSLLLAHGANPSARDAQGRTARDLAEARGHKNIVKLLKKAERKK